ncbi:MAG: ATP-binding protein [Granulosicoccus sp.]
MNSISTRLVVGTGLVLAIFVVLISLSVSYSVHQRAESARLDSLRGLVYGVLGATDINADLHLMVNDQALPDVRFNTISSGLFAELIGYDGSVLWQSESVTQPLPPTRIKPIGDWYFESVNGGPDGKASRLQLSVAWELENGEELPFTVHVVDQADNFNRQLERFDRTLWFSLLVSALVLLGIQLLVLRYSLRPLRSIGSQVADIETGKRDELSDNVPAELSALTSGLNALLRAERQRHAQYRHLLEDLNHTLKTPLTVLRNLAADKDQVTAKAAETIQEQSSLMQTSLQGYSQRANFRGPRYLSPSLPLKPYVQRICNSLHKLYQAQELDFDIAIAEHFSIRMDEADLLEVLGNVLENACKYGATKIQITAQPDTNLLMIDDNGPGFPEGDLQRYKERGIRADSNIAGSGIGLAASQQILANYGATLGLDRASQGGASVVLTFA